MKKFISCVLSIIIFCGSISVPGFSANVKSDTKSIVFDDMPTNYVPTDKLNISGDGVVYVANQAANNKALKVVLKSTSAKVSVPFGESSGKATYSFEIRGNEEIAINVSLLSQAGSECNILLSDNLGNITLVGGPKINTRLSPKKSRKITIFSDTVTKRISVLADGKYCIGDWYLSNMPETLGGFCITATESNDIKSILYIDNLSFCGGYNKNLKAPKAAYNTKVLDKLPEPEGLPGDEAEFEEDEIPEYSGGSISGSSNSGSNGNLENQIGNKVFVNANFDSEDSLSGFQLGAAKDGKNELTYDERRGNGYIYVKSGSGTSRVDVLFDGTRYLVFEADISIAESGFSGELFTFNNGEYGNMLRITSTGQVQAFSGSRVVCDLKKDKWTTISCVCDFEKLTFDIYVNKKLLYSGLSMRASLSGNVNRLRALYLSAGEGAVNFDNLKVYEGVELRDISNEGTQKEEKSVVPDSSIAKALLLNNTALDIRSGAVYSNGEKIIHNNDAYIKDGLVYASAEIASKLFNTNITYNGTNLLADQSIFSDAGIDNENGKNYICVTDLAKNVFDKKIYVDDREFCIISDKNISYTDTELWQIHDYLLYVRPEPELILEMFGKSMAGQHPRIIINKQDIENIKYNYQTKDYYKEWLDGIIKEADKILTYRYYYFDEETGGFSSGARRGVRDRVIYLSLAYFMTGDLKYPQRVYNELVSAGNFKHWRHEAEFLDTAEMMIAFSIGYDWLYDVWTDNQKKYIEDTIMQKGLQYSRAIYYGVGTGVSTWWPTADSNWNSCCNHASAAAAIALMDKYPEFSADIVSKSLRGVEKMLRYFYPSGAWYEGTGYYDYIGEHMSMWVSTLQKNFGTDFNIMMAPTFDISGDYMIAIDGPVASNNFHDASEGHSIPASLSFFGNFYNKPAYTGERLNAIQFYGIKPHFFDILYWPTDFKEGVKANLPKDMKFNGTELAVMRSEYANPEATYISYHAGAIVESHSHVDAGTFVMDMIGVRWATDLGADDYNLDGYFDEYGKRNNYYRVRAEGHNVPVIDPDETSGQDLHAVVPLGELKSGESSAYSIVDLTPAYKKSCESIVRGFMLGENRRTITIRDEYKFLEGEHELYWFMHTRANVEIQDAKTAILSLNGKRLKAQLVTDIEGASFEVMKAEPLPTSPNPKQASNGTAVKLTVHAQNLKDTAYVQVRFSDMDDDMSKLESQDIPISQWTVDNSPYYSKPVLSDIKADGYTLADFDEKITSYLVPVPYKTRQMPQITASANEDCVVEITTAPDISSNTVIKVYRKDNPSDSRNYYIRYQLQTTAEDNQYVPVVITASSNPEPENTEVNAADGNLSTRWSANGDGEWIMYEFAESLPIELIRVAVMNATERKAKFDIEVSDDGINWTKIVEHETDGMTPGYEYIECNTEAKYIRLLGHGNSVNTWNSILEFGIIDTRNW